MQVPMNSGQLAEVEVLRLLQHPLTSVLPGVDMATDAFDGAGVLAGLWRDFMSSSTAKLTQSGGLLTPSTPAESTGFCHTTAATGTSQFSEIIVAGALVAAGQTYWSACVCVTGSNGTRTYYSITVTSDHWYLAKKVSGVNSWETDGSGTFNGSSTPFALRIEAVVSGSDVIITAYKDGVQFATNTDTSSVLSGGQPGLEVYAHTSAITPVSAWSGGDIGGGGGVPLLLRSMLLFN